MGWIRLEDNFYDNPKIIAAGAHGIAVWAASMGWCNRNLTDGIIPAIRSRQLVDFTHHAILTSNHGGEDGDICAEFAIIRLVELGLFHEAGHECGDCVQPPPGAYIIHDYLKYQPSRAEVEAKAEANRERVRKWTDKRKAATNGVTNALATPPLTGQLQDNPNPNPNPSTSPLVTKEGEVALRNAHEATPRPQCSNHPNGNHEGACRGCMKVRQWDEANAAAVQADELEAKRRAREIAERCPDCHGTNLVEIGEDEVIKCNHNQKELQA